MRRDDDEVDLVIASAKIACFVIWVWLTVIIVMTVLPVCDGSKQFICQRNAASAIPLRD